MPVENSADSEARRIKEVYAKRATAVDKRLYSYFNRGNLFIIQERERRMLALLERHGFSPLGTKKVLEVGCGSGFWLREFIKWGAQPQNIVGIDLLPERIAEAQRLCPASVTLVCGSAAELRFPDASFDLVLQSTVFSSVLDEQSQQRIAAEMIRVVKPEGAILWYDFFFDNPRNPDVRGVRKGTIRSLFPNCELAIERITLAPPVVRALAPWSWWGCSFLAAVRILDTHYLALIRRKG